MALIRIESVCGVWDAEIPEELAQKFGQMMKNIDIEPEVRSTAHVANAPYVKDNDGDTWRKHLDGWYSFRNDSVPLMEFDSLFRVYGPLIPMSTPNG